MANIEKLYEESFKDVFKQEFNDAIQILWEEHCKYKSKPWPPSFEDVKKEIENSKRKD